MTWDPKETPFEKLTPREQVRALRDLAGKRRTEARINRTAGFYELASTQMDQARELEDRARKIEDTYNP